MITDEVFKLYCCKDSLATHLSLYSLLDELKSADLYDFYMDIVRPLARVILNLNRRGLYVDEKKRAEAMDSLDREVVMAQAIFNEMVGREINVRGEALGQLLFDELGLRGGKRTKKGKWKINEDVIKGVEKRYPELSDLFYLIIFIRERKKLKETFLLGATPDEDGRVHPSFRIGPATGRLACKKPNFQNIPEGDCRAVYCAPPGYLLVYADYSQIELRILAILADDKPLLATFAEKKDVHDANARSLFALAEGQAVDSIQRIFAKVFIYGLMYGADEHTIATNLSRGLSGNITTPQIVKKMADNFFEEHVAIKKYREWLEQEVRTKRKLYNVFGRPRMFFGPIKEAIRQGYNNPMQSGAADLVNKRMIVVDNEIPNSLVLQVHDALMCEVKEKDADNTKVMMKQIMEEAVPEFGGYSFPVKVKIGENWGQFK